MAPLPEDAYQEHPHARTGANGQRPESDRSHQQPSEESRDDPVHHGYGAGYGQERLPLREPHRHAEDGGRHGAREVVVRGPHEIPLRLGDHLDVEVAYATHPDRVDVVLDAQLQRPLQGHQAQEEQGGQ
jgi:hypothetical protein